MHFDIAWQEVDTVLLDMDGTLLDLAFDNYFWQTLVPETWGAARGLFGTFPLSCSAKASSSTT